MSALTSSNRWLRGAAAVGLAASLLAPVVACADGVAQSDQTAASTSAVSADTPALLPIIHVPFTPDQLAQSNLGLSVFIWDHPETTDRDLNTLKLADIGWQKTLFQWRDIEGAGKGQFDWTESDRVVAASNQAGIRILARIDFEPMWARADHAHNGHPDNPQDYADFVQAFATRYQTGSPYGHVDAIEVWNEPNLQREWGDPISQKSAADYVQMLKLAYAAVKSVDPSIQVVSAGLSPTGWDDGTARPDNNYLQWMFDAGLSGNYDALGVHGNGQAPDPTAAPGSLPEFPDPSFYFRRIEQLRAIQVKNGDASKPTWLMEFGWTSDPVHQDYSWFAVDESTKASNLLAAIQYARANWPWMQEMVLWTLPDPSWGPDREEYWWAISNPDGTPRPALNDLIAAAQTGQLTGQSAPAATGS